MKERDNRDRAAVYPVLREYFRDHLTDIVNHLKPKFAPQVFDLKYPICDCPEVKFWIVDDWSFFLNCDCLQSVDLPELLYVIAPDQSVFGTDRDGLHRFLPADIANNDPDGWEHEKYLTSWPETWQVQRKFCTPSSSDGVEDELLQVSQKDEYNHIFDLVCPALRDYFRDHLADIVNYLKPKFAPEVVGPGKPSELFIEITFWAVDGWQFWMNNLGDAPDELMCVREEAIKDALEESSLLLHCGAPDKTDFELYACGLRRFLPAYIANNDPNAWEDDKHLTGWPETWELQKQFCDPSELSVREECL